MNYAIQRDAKKYWLSLRKFPANQQWP